MRQGCGRKKPALRQFIDPQPQEQLKDDIRHWENGSNTAPGKTGGGQPLIAMTAPAGLSFSTPANIVSYAAKNLDSVAQQHLQLTAGQRFNLNAGKGISLFAHQDGFKAIAHHGKLHLQAQHDDIVANASENLKLTATHGKIIGMASKSVELMTAGGAYIKLDGPNIELGCPGNFLVKSANHDFSGPASMSADLPTFKEGELGRTPQLVRPTDGKPVEGAPFKVAAGDGQIIEGKTGADGKAPPIDADRLKTLSMQFFDPSKP